MSGLGGQSTVIQLKSSNVTYLEIPKRLGVSMNVIELSARKEVTFLERTVQGPPGAGGSSTLTPIDYVYTNADITAEYGKYYIVDADTLITVTAPTGLPVDPFYDFFGVYDGFLKAKDKNIVTTFPLLHGEAGTFTINANAGGGLFRNTGTISGWIKLD
jgi:hypothetical protein